MAGCASPEEHVFVVRVKREVSGAMHNPLRASVLHVGSGHRLSSTNLRDVADFIGLCIGSAAAEEPPAARG